MAHAPFSASSNDLTQAKNRLQEIYQKAQQVLPTYDSSLSVEGWQSVVTLADGAKFVGDKFTSKRTAEASAASVALAALATRPVQQPKFNNSTKITSGSTALLVDVENLPKFIEQLPTELIELIDVYAFVGEHHVLARKIWPSGVKTVVAASTRPNGTDTCIQVAVGYWLAQDKYDCYLIATHDHFGSALVDMITHHHQPLWCQKSAYLVTRPDQI